MIRKELTIYIMLLQITRAYYLLDLPWVSRISGNNPAPRGKKLLLLSRWGTA